jgi:hypothetical protein
LLQVLSIGGEDCAPASDKGYDLAIHKVRNMHHLVNVILQYNSLGIHSESRWDLGFSKLWSSEFDGREFAW